MAVLNIQEVTVNGTTFTLMLASRRSCFRGGEHLHCRPLLVSAHSLCLQVLAF
jgi:hypothetical protein